MKPSEEERCAEARRVQAIAAAFKAGDLGALRAAVEDPAAIPNGPMPLGIGPCLEYAIYHSPIAFIRELIGVGAQLNPPDDAHNGFPPLIAALCKLRARAGSPARADALEVVKLLLDSGADPNQRGINDWTALHMAVSLDAREAIDVLLDAGADPSLRTRIDEYETPGGMAETAGLRDLAGLLERAEKKAR